MVRGGAGNADGQPPAHVDDLASSLQEVTGVYPDSALMARALTHRSFAYEHGGLPHNERLEFLGDSVLGLVVTDHLYDAHPDLTEGQLARLRAAVVNMRALADVGRTLGLGDYLFLGRGEESTGGRDKDSILADSVESVIGAVYLSGGVPAATALVHHILDPLMNATASLGAGLDWKTSLQELAAQHSLGGPEYRIEESGPEHAKTFNARVLVAGEECGTGEGRTKKDAEQQAAAQAWTMLRERLGDPRGTAPVPGLD
ncbi:MAG: ribonuclease III [Phycicoccus sp.]|nr:ribonuclease III [Phycicoccus sp.]